MRNRKIVTHMSPTNSFCCVFSVYIKKIQETVKVSK